jgi:hypothetical protein
MMFVRRTNYPLNTLAHLKFTNKLQYIKYFSKINEPDYMVKSDISADPSEVCIPILREETRKEIYKLYKSDPKQWTVLIRSSTFFINCNDILNFVLD